MQIGRGLTAREEVEVAVAHEPALVFRALLPHREHLHLGVPCIALDLFKADAEQVLVDLEDGGHDDPDGEVFLDERVVEGEALLDELAVVVPVVPDVELAVERQALGLALLLLEPE